MEPYVILDVETTGVDPARDQIFQLALRHSDGRRWTTWINPGIPIPEPIRRLTRADLDAIRQAPPLAAVLPDVIPWLADTTVVGHNVRFDLAFLERRGVRVKQWIDTLEWARIAFPTRTHYRLADFFPEAIGDLHDAETDVEFTETLLHEIRRALSRLPVSTQTDLARILGSEWHWWAISPSPGPADDVRSPLDHPSPEPEPDPMPDPVPVNWDVTQRLHDLGQHVGPDVPWDHRPEQLAVLQRVDQAMREGEILLAQAGTGTGKSLAYLIPAVREALTNGTRVVVATHTLALQEQLWQRDWPLASQGLPARAVLLKGRGRYLCLLRAHQVRDDWHVLGEAAERRWALARLLTYIAVTDRGDGSDTAGNATWDALWREVEVDMDHCIGPRCPYAGPCFMRRSRRDAESSHVLIVNHALLVAHLMTGRALPEFSHIIVDEAHHLGEVVERGFGFEFPIYRWLKQLREMFEGRSAIAQRAQWHPDLLPLFYDLQHQFQRLGQSLGEWAQFLVVESPPSEYDTRMVRLDRERRQLWQTRDGERLWHRLLDTLAEADGGVQTLLAELESRYGAHLSDDRALWRLAQWLKDFPETAHNLIRWGQIDDERVSWWEIRQWSDGNPEVTLRWSWVEIGPLLDRHLWQTVTSATLTSATLGLSGRTPYLAEWLGIDPSRLATVSVPSPFDWDHQARLFLVQDAPDPREPEYWDALAAFLIQTAPIRGGRMLVLLTSNRSVGQLAWRIRTPLEEQGIQTLAQGIDGPPRLIVEQFRQNGRSVLLGTASLWEGVDIPGQALEIVVLARLPFRAPGEPLEEARHERIRQQGKSPFWTRSLPDAIIRFQQGFGRLIRTKSDRGVVVVFDPRIQPNRTRYAATFLQALPAVPWVNLPIASLPERITAFWEEQHAHFAE